MAMNDAERRAFLDQVRPAILSVNEPGRGPQASPVWFDQLENGDLWLVTQTYTQKAKLMPVGARVSLTVQRHKRPYAYVSAEGPVISVVPYTLDDDLYPMAVRYLGEEAARAFIEGRRDSFNPDTAIRVTMRPERYLSADNA